MKPVHIYKLIDPIDNQIKYIGKTSNDLKGRLSSHIWEGGKSGRKHRRSAWIKSLLNKQLKPIIELIETCENNEIANEREKYFIQYYKDQGCDLKNDQPGGDGQPPGYQFKKRHVPPKGETPEHFKKYPHPSTRPDWKEIVAKQQKNRKAPKENPKKRKAILVYDVIENKEYEFDSGRAASKFTGIRVGDISDRCTGRIKSPAKNKYNFSFKENGVNKETISQKIKVIQYKFEPLEINEYPSILMASKITGMKRDTIYKYLNTKKADKNGYYWKTA